MTPTTSVAAVDHAITSRMSTRAFTQQAVSRELITDILQVASRAPSGTNTQPWKVYVLQGASRDALVEQVCAAHEAIRANPEVAKQYEEQYDYYPTQWVSPYIDRRRENGWSLYGLLGIGKGDKDLMHRQQQRNFKFFDAPVGLMFTIDTILGRGSMLDYGMFMQNIMLAARARGLHTCPQAAWNAFHSIILPHIGAAENERLVCGMALGFADEHDKVNTLVTPRVAVDEFTHWVD
jgi:nitroreductase